MATIGSLTDRDLPNTITETAHSVGDKVRDRIDVVGTRLGDLTAKAQHSAMDAKERIQHGMTDAKSRVKQNPIMAVAIGVGVGFILGRVLFR